MDYDYTLYDDDVINEPKPSTLFQLKSINFLFINQTDEIGMQIDL